MHDLEKRPVGIAVDHTLDRAVRLVTDRISELFRPAVQLLGTRHELACDRVGSVRRIDQSRHIRRDRDGIALGDGAQRFGRARRDQACGGERGRVRIVSITRP